MTMLQLSFSKLFLFNFLLSLCCLKSNWFSLQKYGFFFYNSSNFKAVVWTSSGFANSCRVAIALEINLDLHKRHWFESLFKFSNQGGRYGSFYDVVTLLKETKTYDVVTLT